MFIPVYKPELNGHELKYITDCIKTGWVSSIGSYVTKFEKRFAGYCDVRYAGSTCNGTASLHLALVALGVGKGDEVIIPSLTFVATASSVAYTGARPVFSDVDEKTWCINAEGIAKRITKKTKAIIAVHLYGHPCEMGPILDIAKRHNLYLIEDCAEAHGALYKKKKVGSFGDFGCFSFYGNKVITTGEGGMLTTNNKKLYEKIMFLKDHAMSKKKRYYHPVVGYNYRLTNLQAAVGLAQLERIEEFIDKKRKIAAWYNERLNNIPGISIPCEKTWARNVYWMYSILVNKDSGIKRDNLMKALYKRGIDTRPFFYPVHKLPPYLSSLKLSVTERLSKEGINLPSSHTLKEKEIDYICKTIKTIVHG